MRRPLPLCTMAMLPACLAGLHLTCWATLQASELQALVDTGDGEGAIVKLQNELADLRTQANSVLPKCVLELCLRCAVHHAASL